MISYCMPYVYLFFSALIAATFFPLSSEALLSALLYQQHDPFLLWLVATTGNTLGSCVNWYLGKGCLHLQNRKWFPITEVQLARAQAHFQKYGVWSLFFAWLPVIGDPLTLLAGVMRVGFLKFFIIVAIGKASRYGLIVFLARFFI
jgi:membrane protein YqaA with SNARE-associated domain